MTKKYNYEMRKLKTKDIFAMSKILRKMDIKSELDSDGKSPEEFGRDFFFTIMENLENAEEEFNAFFGGLIGISEEEFANLDVEELFDIFEQFKDMGGVQRFLKLMK